MASTITKKNSLCRYFIRYGDCFHGENCQYIHALPPQSSPQPQPQAPMDQPPSTPLPQAQNNISQTQPQLVSHLQQPQQPPAPQNQGYCMNKLICSFKSDLPNEIDFAMQVATVLANTDNFIWSKDYPLVDAICSSLHVFICVCGDISTCYCYPRFWHKILTKNSRNQNLKAATRPPDMEQSFLNFDCLEDHDFKEHNKIYRRIKTAAELMKQFSMTTGISSNDKNDQDQFDFHQLKKKKLKASPSLLKFVSLLLHCDDAILNQIGLDILSNTASKLSKVPEATNDPVCTKLVQMFQDYCVDAISRQDGDIYIVNRSIEVVSRLISSSSRRISSSIINSIVEKNLVFRVEQFLTSHHDVSLFLSALECCYRISRHQPHLLTAGRTRYLMKILVNLLNCDDDRHFTSTALKRIKLIDEEEFNVHHLTPLSKPTLPTQQQQNHKAAPLQPQQQQQQQQQRPKQQQPPTQPQQQPPTQSQQQPPQQTPIKSQPQTQLPTKSPPQPSVKPLSQPLPQQPTMERDPKIDQTQAQPPQPTPPAREYTCEWDNCNAKFIEAKTVYTHVFETHIGPLGSDTISSCLWSGPNGSGPGCITKRPKYSLLTHLNDFHCNPTALERVLNRSQPIKPPEHPGYAPNAALLAIRRHANSHMENTNGSKNLRNESPLSISVRLTAALILRNLATESSEMKQALENHEPLLSEICMTNGRDESKIIAECLSLFCTE